jgi:MFS family permease
MLATLHQRNFALLWFGGLISMIGDWVLFVGLPIYIYTLTGSTLATGIMFIAESLPRILLSSVAGVFADRWDRKRTMIVADLLRALLLLPLLAVQSVDQIWIIYLVAIGMNCISQFFGPAQGALLPNLVDEEHLMAANSLNAISNNCTRLVAPALGGALLGLLGLGAVVLLDSASFLLSALLIALINVPTQSTADQGSTSAASPAEPLPQWTTLWRDWLDGIQVVASDRTITAIFVALGITMMAEGILNVLFVVFVSQTLQGDAQTFGWLVSAQGIGGLLGSMLIGQVSKTISPARLIALSGITNGLILLAIFNMPSLWLALALFVLAGLPVVGFFVGMQTLLQTSVPDHFRGRVLGALGTTLALMVLAGQALASLLGDVVGSLPILSLTGLFNILAGLIALLLLTRALPQAAALEESNAAPASI